MNQSFLTAFNNLILKFIDELILLFPEDSDFAHYKLKILFLKKANAKKLCELFKIYIYNYKDEINNKNEAFFLESDYSETVTKNDNIYKILDKLKLYWKELTDNNKNKIWEYLITLIKISDIV